MKIEENVRKCVVFIGHGGGDNFTAAATGFFVSWDGCPYLVTARHVAENLGNFPFQVRMNTKDGASGEFTFDAEADPIDTWWFSADPEIDIAAILFPIHLQGGDLDQLAIASTLLLSDFAAKAADIGVGDTCYAIGLFRLLQGKKRNFPVVHAGSIAAMPGDESIPVRDRSSHRLRHVRGYLVELTNLDGLSGSPVLVRSSISAIVHQLNIVPNGRTPILSRGNEVAVSVPNHDTKLLGVWSSSWDASPSDVLGVSSPGAGTRVPVGLGTVIPTQGLLDLLDRNEVKMHRQAYKDQNFATTAAAPDSSSAT